MYATLTSTFSNDYFLCVRPNLCAFGAFLHCAFLHCGSPFGLSLTVVLPLDFLSLWFSLWTFLHCGSSSVLSSHCGSSSVLSSHCGSFHFTEREFYTFSYSHILMFSITSHTLSFSYSTCLFSVRLCVWLQLGWWQRRWLSIEPTSRVRWWLVWATMQRQSQGGDILDGGPLLPLPWSAVLCLAGLSK